MKIQTPIKIEEYLADEDLKIQLMTTKILLIKILVQHDDEYPNESSSSKEDPMMNSQKVKSLAVTINKNSNSY